MYTSKIGFVMILSRGDGLQEQRGPWLSLFWVWVFTWCIQSFKSRLRKVMMQGRASPPSPPSDHISCERKMPLSEYLLLAGEYHENLNRADEPKPRKSCLQRERDLTVDHRSVAYKTLEDLSIQAVTMEEMEGSLLKLTWRYRAEFSERKKNHIHGFGAPWLCSFNRDKWWHSCS